MTTTDAEERVARAIKLEIARQWGAAFAAGDPSTKLDALPIARAAIAEMNAMAMEQFGRPMIVRGDGEVEDEPRKN